MKKIYPVTEMIKENPWLMIALPNDVQESIKKEAQKWMKVQQMKINSFHKKEENQDRITPEYCSNLIFEALHTKMKEISIKDNYPLHEDPISKSIYDYVDVLNNISTTGIENFFKK